MIEANGLTRYYGDFAALQDASFTIEDREIVGLLGLNGAGKSTALKLLAGLLLPTAGTVKIGGIDAIEQPDALRRKIGYLPEEPPLYREMRVREFLRWCGELKGGSSAEVAKAMPQVLAVCDLEHMAERVIGELSHGYKKRVGIAQAIIHRPEVVILDEPISGLDPQQIVEMRKVVRSLNEHATVLISSHILSEVEQTCDRVLVIHRGRLVGESASDEPQDKARRLALEVRGQASTLRSVLERVETVTRFDIDAGDDERLRADVVLRDDDRESLARALHEAKLGLWQLAEARSQLEQIFLRLIAGEDPSAARNPSQVETEAEA